MNKLCYSAFIAFWASVATFLALHLLVEDEPTVPDTPQVEQREAVQQSG